MQHLRGIENVDVFVNDDCHLSHYVGRSYLLTCSQAIAHEPFIDACYYQAWGFAKAMDCAAICAPAIGQAAALFGLQNLDRWKQEKRRLSLTRLEALRQAMARNDLTYEVVSAGAFFAYMRHPHDGENAGQVARQLADEQNMLCLPGAFFGSGQENYLRFSFANVEADNTHGTIISSFSDMTPRTISCVIVVALGAGLAAQTADRDRAEAETRRVDDRMRALQNEADGLTGQARTLLGDLRQLEIDRKIQNERVGQAQATVAQGQAAVASTTERLAALESSSVCAIHSGTVSFARSTTSVDWGRRHRIPRCSITWPPRLLTTPTRSNDWSDVSC